MSGVAIAVPEVSRRDGSTGEMSVEEARKFVDDMLIQAQQQQATQQPPPPPAPVRQPRPIEIVVEEGDSPPPSENIDDLRTQVEALEEELRRLK
ncbi:MAG: hypothetical protein HC890_14945 [Chloroflexaceae bacterium]|nr:hypothetical protein [Chloroflexaceae bacterium]